MNCQYCDKECKNGNSLRNHERLCKHNPNRQQSNLAKHNETGIPWNKGLTKECDARVAQNAGAISKATKGKPSSTIWTEEMKEAKSKWRKQYHKDHPEAHPNRKLSGNRNKMSYPEKVAYDFLVSLGVEFTHNQQVSKFYPDFVVGNKIIEIDGARWHDATRDAVRDEELKLMGYTVYRIDTRQHIETEIQRIIGL